MPWCEGDSLQGFVVFAGVFLRGVLEKERFWCGVLLVRTWWNVW
jgi:hypothetical protein